MLCMCGSCHADNEGFLATQGSYFNLTLEWLVKHAYPPGPIHLTRTHLPTLPLYYSVGNFKVHSSFTTYADLIRTAITIDSA